MTKPSSRLRGISQSPNFLRRVGFRAVKDRFEKAGRKAYALCGGNVLTWGHSNDALTQILTEIAASGWGGHYAGQTNFVQELKESIAYFEKDVRKIDCSPEDVIPVPGVGGGWHLLHYCLLDPGDEILCVHPAHYMWNPASYLSYYGAKAVTSRTHESDGWEPDLEDLRSKISSKTKAIVMVHPNNPTSAVHTDKVLENILAMAGEHELMVIADEIYMLINYDRREVRSLVSMASDIPVVTMYSTSKFFLKPGWRLGFIHIHDPKDKVKEFKTILKTVGNTYGHGTHLLSTVMLAAGARAFRGPYETERKFVAKLEPRRDYTFKRLNEIEGIKCTKPRAGLYAFPRVEGIGKKWVNDEEFLVSLLEEEGIVFLPGSFFGPQGFGHFRTLLLPDIEILEEVYSRLERFMKRHS